MALDFHIARTPQEAEVAPCAWALDDTTHRLLFQYFDGREGFPQLQRLRNYFSDVAYGNDELPALLEELNGAIPTFANRSPLRVVLEGFREVCAQALAEGKSLYGLCD